MPSDRLLVPPGHPGKGFQRLTSPLPVTWAELSHTPPFASPVAVEIFGAAEDVLAQFPPRRQAPSFVVWEPHAKTCLPAMRELHAQACERVDVFSPNHEELAALFATDGEKGGFDRATVEAQAAVFLQPGKCVVVRCAEHGCFVLAHGESAMWLPPFFDVGESAQGHIVDATGAGNTFLGAFAVGWLETASYIIAAEWGTVAASFAMEQVGVPRRQETMGGEMWNGVSVRRRLDDYRCKFRR
nr:uncharacterized protein c16c9.01c [Quercus suber]